VSRPRSATARGASAPAAGRAAGRPGVFVQTPRSDIYVALLGIALGAMIVGCILLALVLKRYEFSVKAAGNTVPARAAVASLLEKSGNPTAVHL
jgi:hypothetical protein